MFMQNIWQKRGSVLSLAATTTVLVAIASSIFWHSAPRVVQASIRVFDSSTQKTISRAQVSVENPRIVELTDDYGVANITMPQSPRTSIHVTVIAEGYRVGSVEITPGSKELLLDVPLERTSNPPISATPTVLATTRVVCHFYAEANQGSNAVNHDDVCMIPDTRNLDLSYQQNDFICCGGGATSSTTNANIPRGIELRVTGGHYWAVLNPQLQGDRFSVHTYCGAEPAPGPGCHVDVAVLGHYRVPRS